MQDETLDGGTRREECMMVVRVGEAHDCLLKVDSVATDQYPSTIVEGANKPSESAGAVSHRDQPAQRPQVLDA